MAYEKDRISRLLDEALEMTFPASDPIAVSSYADAWRPAREPGPDGNKRAASRAQKEESVH